MSADKNFKVGQEVEIDGQKGIVVRAGAIQPDAVPVTVTAPAENTEVTFDVQIPGGDHGDNLYKRQLKGTEFKELTDARRAHFDALDAAPTEPAKELGARQKGPNYDKVARSRGVEPGTAAAKAAHIQAAAPASEPRSGSATTRDTPNEISARTTENSPAKTVTNQAAPKATPKAAAKAESRGGVVSRVRGAAKSLVGK